MRRGRRQHRAAPQGGVLLRPVVHAQRGVQCPEQEILERDPGTADGRQPPVRGGGALLGPPLGHEPPSRAGADGRGQQGRAQCGILPHDRPGAIDDEPRGRTRQLHAHRQGPRAVLLGGRFCRGLREVDGAAGLRDPHSRRGWCRVCLLEGTQLQLARFLHCYGEQRCFCSSRGGFQVRSEFQRTRRKSELRESLRRGYYLGIFPVDPSLLVGRG
mmetsp:Transcript_36579/g.82251  ORF Transcript_36579/g.82251 Transcript_36579/m.82251 type:complete len:215 (-) Transcript_36579:381-1025(-)